jgi:hypothetical protein
MFDNSSGDNSSGDNSSGDNRWELEMKTRMKALAVICLMSGSMTAGAGTAKAALNQCTGNKTCLWGNNGFDFLLSTRSENLGNLNLGAGATNRMDSWANLSAANTARGNDFANGAGSCQTFGKASNDTNVNPFNSDEVSSYRTNSGC